MKRFIIPSAQTSAKLVPAWLVFFWSPWRPALELIQVTIATASRCLSALMILDPTRKTLWRFQDIQTLEAADVCRCSALLFDLTRSPAEEPEGFKHHGATFPFFLDWRPQTLFVLGPLGTPLLPLLIEEVHHVSVDPPAFLHSWHKAAFPLQDTSGNVARVRRTCPAARTLAGSEVSEDWSGSKLKGFKRKHVRWPRP